MCLLWGTNWVFISQKTAFFTVTAVKPQLLHIQSTCRDSRIMQHNRTSFLIERLFIINSVLWSLSRFGSVQRGLHNRAPIAYCVSGPLIPLSIDGTQQFLILRDLPPGSRRSARCGGSDIRLSFSLCLQTIGRLHRQQRARSKYINHSWGTSLYCNITLRAVITVGCRCKVTALRRLECLRWIPSARQWRRVWKNIFAKNPGQMLSGAPPSPGLTPCVFTQYPEAPYWSGGRGDEGELFSMVNKCSGKVICSAYNLGDPLASSALSRQRLQWLTQPYPSLPLYLPPPHVIPCPPPRTAAEGTFRPSLLTASGNQWNIQIAFLNWPRGERQRR
jgi:hypothetical protein